jgi:hypothetical protein
MRIAQANNGHEFIMHSTRQTWISHLLQIANPVFDALARNELAKNMPAEQPERKAFQHLEALGRSLAGIGPWLECQDETSLEESHQRNQLLECVRESIKNATQTESPDFMNFTAPGQPLVDAAFLAQGLLRSWNSVWLKLPSTVQESVIVCMLATRHTRPGFNNWLLFSAMIEGFLCKAGQPWDKMRTDYAIRQHEQWYKGDGAYGDGPAFHWDYYNSFVIQPMLFDLTHTIPEIGEMWPDHKARIAARAKRYAAIQERMISPDGTFPVFGRSLVYRFGIFHHLATMVLHNQIPAEIPLAGTRCAMTAAMQRLLRAEGTFDTNGWLQIGFCGHQPALGEHYISTGSLYLTLCGFLPLGLATTHPFWSDPDTDWTAKRIWNGQNLPCDHAIPN